MVTTENIIPVNRTEELGYDLWDSFVIPPYYDVLDLTTVKKPKVFVGGRGCGKTMLLRYLCHETQFSPNRPNLQDSDIENIGIYWRIDTQFAKMLKKRAVNDDVWERAFEHMAVLLMSIEILRSLESIANSSYPSFNKQSLEQLSFDILNSFDESIPTRFEPLKLFVRRQFNNFQTWAGNTTVTKQPVFLPKKFITELINEIKDQHSAFSKTNYLVYIDEYENLLVEQKILINTWLKHSEMPLIFNLAMKRNSFQERGTLGQERLSDIHDYREYDLESFYNKAIRFDVFAAEIWYLRLEKTGRRNLPLVVDELRRSDQEYVAKRKSAAYQKKVLTAAKEMFPGVSPAQLAETVFKDSILTNRLQYIISTGLGLKQSTNKISDFLDDAFPEASIVSAALLHRKTVQVSEIIDNLDKLKTGKPNQFTGKTNWIHNNIVGCLLLLYEPLGRVCPLYSGFETFCQMSNTNLRHFLELCNKSLQNQTLYGNAEVKNIQSIDPAYQSEAAKQASTGFLKEIKSFGANGNDLHTFTMRLGTFFQFAQKRLSQSEPEQNHFALKDHLTTDVQTFLDEAVKYSVLYESPLTKQKHTGQADFFEFILNPIYSPYFQISFRKKRRAEFSNHDIKTLISGEIGAYEKLLKFYLKSWNILSEADATLSLFPEKTT